MENSAVHSEGERQAALDVYGILDTPPEAGFEHITSLVARLFAVPIAAVTLVDANRQWFKSIRGLDVCETPRDQSFCNHAMRGREVMVIPDATLDPRFAHNPLVTGEVGIRFYAGAPLRTPEGHPLGALCAIDRKPRQFSASDQQILLELATLVEDELLLRRMARELHTETVNRREAETARDAERERGLQWRAQLNQAAHPSSGTGSGSSDVREASLTAGTDRFREVVEQATDPIFVYDSLGRFVDVNAASCELLGYTREELLGGLNVSDIEVTFDPVSGPRRWREMDAEVPLTLESLNRRQDGSVFWAEVRISVVETEAGRFQIGLVRDITQRRQAENLLRTRARQQRAVAELGVKALQSVAFDTLLDEALTIIGEILQLEICRVLEYVPERRELLTRAGLNLPVEERGQVAVHDHGNFIGMHVVRTGEAVILKNVQHDPRFNPAPWLVASGATSGVHIPIGGDGSHSPQYGVLAAYTREQRDFTEDDLYFVQSVANVLAAAVARQRGEDALRVVEARYQRIAAHTPGVVYQYLLGADGTLSIPFISESCRQFFGREPKELQARPAILEEQVHPDDRPGFVEAARQTKTTLTPLSWEGRNLQADGEIRWVRYESRPERLPDGGIICDGIITDVTADRRREEALRATEERFRLANFHAPFPILLYTGDGKVLQVNDAWVHLTGYSAEQIPTMEAWLQLAYHPEAARSEVRAFLATLPDHIGAVELPGCHVRCAGGQTRVWDFKFAHLGRLPDGGWLRIASAVDVTEQRRQEGELRTAKEEAERANAAKSLFLSRMSHELRTPLNAILGFGQLLELSPLSPDDVQSVGLILNGGRHLLSLVDEVLDLARVETGEIGLQLAAVPLHKLASECVRFVARSAQTQNVTCEVDPGHFWEGFVLADEQRLRQVLLNLLSNAIKYNRAGGKVTITAERTRHDRVRLNVKDTGLGISADGIDRLFVPFERLGHEHGEVEGTGLGLVVSRSLMEVMDGGLGVESEVGRGSVFWIDLPAAEEAPRSTLEPRATGLTPANVAFRAPAAVTVLYVEDNPSNVQVVQRVVGRLRPHWRFVSAPDGISGLARVRAERPEVVLLDLQLPGMKGDAVLEALRADPATRDLPVLLLSADAMSHSRERLLALGANDYLAKPFNLGELLNKLDSLLATA